MILTVLSIMISIIVGYLVIAGSLILIGNIIGLAIKYFPITILIILVSFMVLKPKNAQVVASQTRAPQSIIQPDSRAELVKGHRTWNF